MKDNLFPQRSICEIVFFTWKSGVSKLVQHGYAQYTTFNSFFLDTASQESHSNTQTHVPKNPCLTTFQIWKSSNLTFSLVASQTQHTEYTISLAHTKIPPIIWKIFIEQRWRGQPFDLQTDNLLTWLRGKMLTTYPLRFACVQIYIYML